MQKQKTTTELKYHNKNFGVYFKCNACECIKRVYKIRDIEWIRCMNGIARQDDDNNNSNKIRDI